MCVLYPQWGVFSFQGIYLFAALHIKAAFFESENLLMGGQMHNHSGFNKKSNVRPKTKKQHFILSSRFVRMVNEAAYYRALRRGFLPGYELLDWLEAEEETKRHYYKALF